MKALLVAALLALPSAVHADAARSWGALVARTGQEGVLFNPNLPGLKLAKGISTQVGSDHYVFAAYPDRGSEGRAKVLLLKANCDVLGRVRSGDKGICPDYRAEAFLSDDAGVLAGAFQVADGKAVPLEREAEERFRTVSRVWLQTASAPRRPREVAGRVLRYAPESAGFASLHALEDAGDYKRLADGSSKRSGPAVDGPVAARPGPHARSFSALVAKGFKPRRDIPAPAAKKAEAAPVFGDQLKRSWKNAVAALPGRETVVGVYQKLWRTAVSAVDWVEDKTLRFVLTHPGARALLTKITGVEKAKLYRGVSTAEAEHIRANDGSYDLADERNLYKFATPNRKLAELYAKRQNGRVLEIEADEAIPYFRISGLWNTAQFEGVAQEYLVLLNGREKVRVVARAP